VSKQPVSPKNDDANSVEKSVSPNGVDATGTNNAGESAEQPIRLVILSKDASSVKATAGFLVRRGVEVFATTLFQEAVDKLASDWTRFILLSVNYPHPKIEMVPQLLAQSFNVDALVFSELGDRKSNTRLTASKAKHIIFGTVSGPVVLMRLTQILKEQNQPEDGAMSITKSSSSAADDSSINVKGGTTTIKSVDKVKRLMAELGEPSAEQSAEQSAVQSGTTAATKSGLAAGVAIQKGNRGQLHLLVPPPTLASKKGIREALKAGKMKPAQPKIDASILNPPSMIEGSESLGINPETEVPITPPNQQAVDLLDRCVRAALKECCGWPRDQKEVLIDYRTVSVLVFHTSFFRGSILFAVGRGQFDHTQMLKSIETEFVFQIIQAGVDIGIGEIERYAITPASAAEDAFLAAITSAVSRSDKLEVGIAVLDLVPEEPEIVENADLMIAVKPDAIEPDARLDFEVFLHLPLNGRYVKYVKEGYSISRSQSTRLSSSNKQSIYLTKSASSAFRQHASVSSLKRKIAKKAG
jgi:DNA-binding response OmpR family regulator